MVCLSGDGCLQVLFGLPIDCVHFLAIFDVRRCRMVGFHGPFWYHLSFLSSTEEGLGYFFHTRCVLG